MPALTLRPGGSLAALPNRVWIDTDAACGTGPRVHPDDGLAALALREDARIHMISDVTVFGNAPAQTTQRVTGALVQRINGHRAKPVRAFGESAAASSDTPTPIEDAAHRIMAPSRHRAIAPSRHRVIASLRHRAIASSPYSVGVVQGAVDSRGVGTAHDRGGCGRARFCPATKRERYRCCDRAARPPPFPSVGELVIRCGGLRTWRGVQRLQLRFRSTRGATGDRLTAAARLVDLRSGAPSRAGRDFPRRAGKAQRSRRVDGRTMQAVAFVLATQDWQKPRLSVRRDGHCVHPRSRTVSVGRSACVARSRSAARPISARAGAGGRALRVGAGRRFGRVERLLFGRVG